MNLDLERCFGEMKPQERTLLWLAYVEGNEHKEIARMLGLKEKSIRVLLFRARQRLSALLQPKGNKEEP
jgi:RNA polymerase sigma-70 factor (ECF subfamily)